MVRTQDRASKRQVRHRHIRKRIVGLPTRPRLCVYRSLKHLYVQVVDDTIGRTLLGCSTKDERLKPLASTGNIDAAKALGTLVAGEAQLRGITSVVFDRGGYLYHGRIKAVAEAAREGGLHF